jgi:hypothetical protein
MRERDPLVADSPLPGSRRFNSREHLALRGTALSVAAMLMRRAVFDNRIFRPTRRLLGSRDTIDGFDF